MKKSDMKKDTRYMHVHTGTVQTGAEWLDDYEHAHKAGDEGAETWETWEGGVLIEVPRYRGHIRDRMRSLPSHMTRWYSTYADAHAAAERLAKKYYESRAEISVMAE